MSAECACHNRVEPCTSVNRNVTFPEGGCTAAAFATTSGHGARRERGGRDREELVELQGTTLDGECAQLRRGELVRQPEIELGAFGLEEDRPSPRCRAP